MISQMEKVIVGRKFWSTNELNIFRLSRMIYSLSIVLDGTVFNNFLDKF